MKTTVVNRRREKADVYIGRGSLWGNPFEIDLDGSREEVIALYRDYFFNKITEEGFSAKTHALKGKKLGCFCKPLECHGDVIAEYLNLIYEK